MAFQYANTEHEFAQLSDLRLHTYNSRDVYNTGQLAGDLFRQFANPLLAPNLQWYREWLEPLSDAVVAMARRGLLVDRAELRRYSLQLTGELHETDTAIRRAADAVGFKYTGKFPNSDAQVARLLFDTLGLKAGKRTDSGRPSVDTEALQRVLKDFRKKDEPHRELLYNLFHRSRLQTIRERYLELPIDPDDRVRARVKMTGTKTWRFAYADPALQQYPPEVRGIFVTRPGHLLVGVDYSQLEARILAVLSDDLPSLDVFRVGGDIHRANAFDLFNYDEAGWSALNPTIAKAARNFAKTYLYGISYGGSAETMKMKVYCPCPRCADKMPPTLAIKRDEVKRAELRWQAAHPAVGKFQHEVAEFVRSRHYYESPLGYRRFIGKPWGADLERELKNIPEQMNAALLMHRAQVRLHRLGFPILLQHHDSFLFELPDDASLAQHVADIKGVMEAPVPELDGAVFPCDAEVGPSWGRLEKLAV